MCTSKNQSRQSISSGSQRIFARSSFAEAAESRARVVAAEHVVVVRGEGHEGPQHVADLVLLVRETRKCPRGGRQ